MRIRLIAAAVAAGLVLAAGPADAAQGVGGVAGAVVGDCDPVGNIFLNPSASVVSGGTVSVSWSTRNIAACNGNVLMSGPGFSGQEVVSGAGKRQVVVTQSGPSTAQWVLSIGGSRGQSEITFATVLVTAPVPPADPRLGGAVAFAGNGGVTTTITGSTLVASDGETVQNHVSPSVAYVGGQYVTAYTGQDSELWIMDQSGHAVNTRELVRAGTSPSIVATDASHYLVAFQGGDTVLRTYNSDGALHYIGLAMDGVSSPSATLTTAGVAIAYVDGNGHLSVFDPALGYGGFGVSVMAGSSPAITYILGSPDSYRIAYEDTNRVVHTVDSSGATAVTPLTAAAGTDPAITTLPSGQIDLAVNASDGSIKYVTTAAPGVAVTIADSSGFEAGTSPTVAAEASGGGAVFAWASSDGRLHVFGDGTSVLSTDFALFAGSSPAWAAPSDTVR